MTPEEFFAILQAVPEAPAVTHRLYHDEAGRVLFYSMEDLPGMWILVDAPTYAAARHDIRVIDGKIVELPKQQPISKLRPSDQGVACDVRDICLVVDPAQPHQRWTLHHDQD